MPTQFSYYLLGIGVIAALASLLLTEGLRRSLIKKAVYDIPNARSSHKKPVPRGGGMAVMAVILSGMLGAILWDFGVGWDVGPHMLIFAATGLLVGISLYDDRVGAPAALRFVAHLAAACIGIAAFSPHQYLLGGLLPFWLDRAVIVIGWAWFMNLYNFMDGIDGITSVETISIALGAALLFSVTGISGEWFLPVLLAMLIGSMAGFLRHNWHPARIFLGDSGSVPLGFLIGYVLITLAMQGHVAAALTLPLYYIVDSGLTIIKRALRREKIWQAHRQHFYQKAALGVGQHDKVVLWIGLANLALIGAAMVARPHPAAGFGAGIVIVAILLGKMHKSASSFSVSS